MSELPTIAIAAAEAPGGYMLINASEFDAAKHQRWGDVPERQTAEEWAEMQSVESAPAGPDETSAPAEANETPALEDMTLTDLRSLARERDIPGRSNMDKDELIEALR